ncbi:MAG: DnaJ domain-containing protein [Clostridia bacterium]|nr:DnaJ domain-containing protein [Clostridia bacterium]
MNNPFEVLGVSQNATDDQIREAYRYQVRKYNEELEQNPNSAFARQKLSDLDRAYDEIIMSRSGYGSQKGNAYTQQGGNYGNYSAPADFSDIREKIRAGRLDDAQILLDGVPEFNRSAEWYYLKGTVQQRKGWLEEAYGNFAAACRLDPSNPEYKAAFDSMQNSRSGGYRTVRNDRRGASFCDVCTGLLCADCCCECMGGDLISCC